MSRTRPPAYRHHKATGQAVSTIRTADGRRKDVYLGPWKSEASQAAYQRLLADLSAARVKSTARENNLDPSADLTVNELLVAYVRHADRHYRTPAGSHTSEYGSILATVRVVKRLYGYVPAAEFKPSALRAVRAQMIDAGLARSTINSRIGHVRRIFAWGVSEDLVPVDVHSALKLVQGLQAGRTEAREPPPVKPADLVAVEKVIAVLPPPLAALVRLQSLCAARGGELLAMKANEVNRVGPVWEYRPSVHKTSWRGKERVIHFGPDAQRVLAPWLDRAGEGYVFSPAVAEDERRAKGSAARKTKLWPSHVERNRAKRKRSPVRKPGERYTTDSYRRAVTRACEKAGVPVFRPHQLRHAAVLRIRTEMGLEYARATAGHSLASVTELYSKDIDARLAAECAAKLG